MKLLTKLTILALIPTLFACEKVIDIELNDAERKIVVEAFTSNIEGRSYIKLSKTGNVYTENNFDQVSNAAVTITDKNGTVYTFNEDDATPGMYLLPGFTVEENNTYNLKIVAEGQEITAKSESSFVPAIDFAAGFPTSDLTGEAKDTARIIAYQFTDPPSAGDNYRFILTINGEEDDYYYLGNDLLGNNQSYEGVFFATSVDSGDVVHIELLTMDNASYDYYYSLVNNTGTGPFSATPSNPVSNVSDNALGYFGAYLMDTTTITVY